MTEILEVKDWFPVVTRSSDDLMILGYVKESTELLQIGVISGLNESVIQDQDDQLYHLVTEPKYLPLDSQDTEFFYPVNRAKFQEFMNTWSTKNSQQCFDNFILSFQTEESVHPDEQALPPTQTQKVKEWLADFNSPEQDSIQPNVASTVKPVQEFENLKPVPTEFQSEYTKYTNQDIEKTMEKTLENEKTVDFREKYEEYRKNSIVVSTWGVQVLVDKTNIQRLYIISERYDHRKKRNARYRYPVVDDCIVRECPFVMVKLQTGKILQLRGAIHPPFCLPTRMSHCIASAFVDGFPHYWRSCVDIFNRIIALCPIRGIKDDPTESDEENLEFITKKGMELPKPVLSNPLPPPNIPKIPSNIPDLPRDVRPEQNSAALSVLQKPEPMNIDETNEKILVTVPYKPTPPAPIVPPPASFVQEESPKRTWLHTRFQKIRNIEKVAEIKGLNKSVNRVQFEDDLPDKNTAQKHMLHSTPFVQRKKSGFFGDTKSYSPILKKPQKKTNRISPLIDEPVSPIACNPAVDPVSPVLSDKDYGILPHEKRPREPSNESNTQSTGEELKNPFPKDKDKQGTRQEEDVTTEKPKPVVTRPKRKRVKTAQEPVEKSPEPVKEKSKKKTNKKPENEQPDEPVKITAAKGTKKFKQQREEYLRKNQEKAGVDVTLSEEAPTSDHSMELTFSQVEKKNSQNGPSQGRQTPTWFQTPNQSDTETAINSQATESENDSDAENKEIVQKRSTKVFNKKLTNKVLKKKNPSKTKKTSKKKTSKESSILTETNSKQLQDKLKLVAIKQRKKFISDSESDSEESELSVATTATNV